MKQTLKRCFVCILLVLTMLVTAQETSFEFEFESWYGYSNIDSFTDENYSTAYVWANATSQGAEGSLDINCDTSQTHGLLISVYIDENIFARNSFHAFQYRFDQASPGSFSGDLYINNETAIIEIDVDNIPFFVTNLSNSSKLAFRTNLEGKQFTYEFDVRRFRDVLSTLKCYRQTPDPFADVPATPLTPISSIQQINGWSVEVTNDPFSEQINSAIVLANEKSQGFEGSLYVACDASLENGIFFNVAILGNAENQIFEEIGVSSRSFDFKFDSEEVDTAIGKFEVIDYEYAELEKRDEMLYFIPELEISSTLAFRTQLQGEQITYTFDVAGFSSVLDSLACYRF